MNTTEVARNLERLVNAWDEYTDGEIKTALVGPSEIELLRAAAKALLEQGG